MSGRQLAIVVAVILAMGAVITYAMYGSVFATPLFH